MKKRAKLGSEPADNLDWLERRGITDQRVLDAMRNIDREPFYAEQNDATAHSSRLDRTTITPPEVIAKMIVAMRIPSDANVLQIGTGSGYIPALLSTMSHAVFTTETDQEAARGAAARLSKMGIKNVEVLFGATLNDYAAHGPYQAILISAGMARIPDRLAKRLSIGGVLVAPVGSGRRQQLVRLTRNSDDDFETELLGDLRVMPLLGDILVEMGILDREEVEIAAFEADVGGKMLGEAMLEGHNVKESDIYRALAKQRGLQLIDARDALSQLDRDTANSIPRAFLSHNRLIPIDRREGVLHIATTDAATDSDDLAAALGIQMLELLLITPTDFQLVWDAFDTKKRQDETSLDLASEVVDEDFVPLSATTISNFERILHEAIQIGASDVHFEREEEIVNVRFRVDGVLRLFPVDLDPDRLAEIAHLVKVSARMERVGPRLPRSGHFQRRFSDRVFDIRATILPGLFGEHISLRILPQDGDILSLAELGFPEAVIDPMRDVLRRSHGIVLVVGKSGAGRSTTLNSLLTELVNAGDKKIVSVEYPVTYDLPGVQQVRVDPSIGFGVEEAVSAAIASDLDVILIGELNSARMAQLAIDASRGGLLVLSTILGRDVFEAFDRMEEFGVTRRSAIRELEAVIAQDLVPRICVNCRQPASHDDAVANLLFDGKDYAAFHGLGCTQCGDRGTRGRVAVSEFLQVPQSVKDVVGSGTRKEVIEAAKCYVSKETSARILVERGTMSPNEIEFLELS